MKELELIEKEKVGKVKTRNWTKAGVPCPSCGHGITYKTKRLGGIILHCPNCSYRFGVKGTSDVWEALNFFETHWTDDMLPRWGERNE